MRESRSQAPAFIPYLLLAAAVFVAYANIFGNAFLSDDTVLIVNNKLLQSWRHWPVFLTKTLVPGCPYYRPVQGFLNLITYQIAGLSLFAFHLPNAPLHAANGGLVYALGRKLGFAPVPVFLAALLWALHPIQTESVTQISGVADVLYSFFCLLGVIILFPDFSRRRFFAAVPLMALGLLSKEAAIVFPLLALSCLFYCPSGKRFDFRAWLRVWPLIVTALIYVILWLVVLYSIFQPSYMKVDNGQPAVFNYAALATPFYYFKMMLWPVGLHMEHDLPVYHDMRHADVLAGLALMLLAAIQILRPQSANSRPFSWGLGWFIAAQLPTAFFFSDNKVYEHWMYLPSAGLMLGAMQSLYLYASGQLPLSRRTINFMGVGAALLLAPLLGFLTFKQNKIWHAPEAFYQNTIAHDVGPALGAHFNLGAFYAQSGEYEKAVEQFRFAVAHAGEGALSHAMLASIQIEWGATLAAMPKSDQNREEALAHFQEALTIDPTNALALDALSHMYMDHGDAVEAALYRAKAAAARAKAVTLFDSHAEIEGRKE